MPATPVTFVTSLLPLWCGFCPSEKDVRLAQKLRVGPCIHVGIQLYKAKVGPTSGPTWRLSHWECDLSIPRGRYPSVKTEGHDLHLVDHRLLLLLTILQVSPYEPRDVRLSRSTPRQPPGCRSRFCFRFCPWFRCGGLFQRLAPSARVLRLCCRVSARHALPRTLRTRGTSASMPLLLLRRFIASCLRSAPGPLLRHSLTRRLLRHLNFCRRISIGRRSQTGTIYYAIRL